jgi:hypothetical protein
MIHPISNQVGWAYVAVPVWQLETPAAPPAAVGSTCAPEAGAGPDLAPLPEQEPRLVFKGYEWRPVAHWNPFVNPGWDHWVDNDPEEIRERQLRVERERQQAQVVAPTQRTQADPLASPMPGCAAGDPHHDLSPAAGTIPKER